MRARCWVLRVCAALGAVPPLEGKLWNCCSLKSVSRRTMKRYGHEKQLQPKLAAVSRAGLCACAQQTSVCVVARD